MTEHTDNNRHQTSPGGDIPAVEYYRQSLRQADHIAAWERIHIAEQLSAAKAICNGTFALSHLEAVNTLLTANSHTGIAVDHVEAAISSHLGCAQDYVSSARLNLSRTLNMMEGSSEPHGELHLDIQTGLEMYTDAKETLTSIVAKTSHSPSDQDVPPSSDSPGVSSWKEVSRINTQSPESDADLPTVEDLKDASEWIAQSVIVLNMGLAEKHNHCIVSTHAPPETVSNQTAHMNSGNVVPTSGSQLSGLQTANQI